jgi:tetratricopeptide (TPR) repeat protein
MGNRLGQANQLGNLGNVFALRGMADKALEYYREALKLFEEIGAESQVRKTKRLIGQLEKRN